MMRSTLVRLAESVTKRPLNLQEASATLIPPIPLYRRLLRAHRYIPREMRSLGDDYVKAGAHICKYVDDWTPDLSAFIPKGPEAARFEGRKLDPMVFEKMSDEQMGQLYELMHVTKDVWKSPEDLEKMGSDSGKGGESS
ncbi:hypothetical protein EVG20_g6948 [Dentipellis fragilis]|uniref:Succinate dehydrogenase assembly factor 3 n=1 Tax=Dentipellis fragilis TaxID=205917 RepID=A0A4Y9YIB6_9AGAM|nr:hypothetical protein EVG20_g6948 [Dentipellis fragilis]